MSEEQIGKRSRVRVLQKCFLNPPMKRAVSSGLVPGHALLETTGRKSGKIRHTVVGVHREGLCVWVVAEQRRHAGYVRNVEAEPRVRLRLDRRWYRGEAHIVDDDAPQARLDLFERTSHAAAVRRFGTNLLTIRIDVDK